MIINYSKKNRKKLAWFENITHVAFLVYTATTPLSVWWISTWLDQNKKQLNWYFQKKFPYSSLCSRHIVVRRPDREAANSARRAIGPGEYETSLPW
jgi:hypothetical protein